jgi:hypothetical protein
MNIGILFAILGVGSYTAYSRFFSASVEHTKGKILTAPAIISSIILYFTAAGLLFLTSFCASFIFTDAWSTFELPLKTELWAYNLNIPNYSTTTDIILSLSIMIFGYAASIISESASRQQVNVASFDITYQLNAPVVVVLTGLFASSSLIASDWIGGLLIVFASILPLLVRSKLDKDFSKTISFWTIFSGITCGIALFTDANFTKQIIFLPEFSWQKTPIFIAYEAITFFGPFLIAILFFFLKYGIKQFSDDIIAIKRDSKKTYFWAAFYSALYYVFSVWAFSVGNNLIIATIFGLIPLINVWFDPKERPKQQKNAEYMAAVLLFIGFLFVSHIINL